MPRKLGAVNIFEAAWLNRFLGDAREFRRLRKVEKNFSEAGLPDAGKCYESYSKANVQNFYFTTIFPTSGNSPGR